MKIVRLYLLFRVFGALLEVQGQDVPDSSSYPLNGTGRCLDISDGYLKDLTGNLYDIGKLLPLENVLVSRNLDIAGTVSVFRATYDDGEATLLAQKDSNGSIINAELSGRSQSSPLHFVKTSECNQVDELFVFAETEINDFEYEGLDFGEGQSSSLGDTDDLDPETRSDHIYVAGDGSSLECRFFKVVKVGIVYDAEFCRKYGGHDETESRIMLIVAAASLLYENEMCVKLQLVGIYTPDENCAATSIFSSMRRDKACGSGTTSDTFIRYFADWMNRNRSATGMDRDAVVHAFTGFPPRGALGCAYTGSMCRTPQFMYGVEYMSSNFLSTQSVIFAHELGHNLNARHLTAEESGTKRYIMKPALQNPHDGFGFLTIDRILSFLDLPEVTCDVVSSSSRAPTRPQTWTPVRPPSPKPSTKPPVWTKAPARPQTLAPIRPPSPMPTTKAPVWTKAPARPQTLAPVRAPSPRPTTKAPVWTRVPSRPQTPTPGSPPASKQYCGFADTEVESVCFLGSDQLLGCVEAGRLVIFEPNEFCTEPNIVVDRIALTSCQDAESSNDEAGLNLRFLATDDDNDANADNYIPFAEGSYLDRSDDPTLESFSNSNCQRLGCTAVNNFVCFATALESGQSAKEYALGFEAYIDGRLDRFTTVVRVTQSSDSQGCISPETVCLDG